jgi:hypothetical protein
LNSIRFNRWRNTVALKVQHASNHSGRFLDQLEADEAKLVLARGPYANLERFDLLIQVQPSFQYDPRYRALGLSKRTLIKHLVARSADNIQPGIRVAEGNFTENA